MAYGNFDGLSIDNELITGWASLNNKPQKIWLIDINTENKLSIMPSKFRVDKAAIGEYPYCGFEIHIDSLPDYLNQENIYLKICFDYEGKYLLPGNKQPFLIPKILNNSNSINSHFEYNFSDKIPSLLYKQIKLLRNYGGFYRDWYSRNYLQKEATAYEPELSIISYENFSSKPINPYGEFIPEEFLKSNLENNYLVKSNMAGYKKENFIISSKKLKLNKEPLIPENFTPQFRQTLINALKIAKHKITVITASWNRANTIQRSIDSALNQTYSPFEVILCDDGSNDDTIQKIKKSFPLSILQKKLKIIESKHLGVSNARNLALGESKGDLIAYLDSDNTWHPDHLLFLTFFLMHNIKDYDLIYSTRRLFGSRVNGKILPLNPFDYRKLKIGNFIDLNCMMHKRKLYEKEGGFDLNLKRLVDWEIMLKYTNPKLNTKVTSINIATVNYWRNQKYFNNISNNEDWEVSRRAIKNKHYINI